MQSFPEQPELVLTQTEDYRDNYANSVQVRSSVWDFYLAFGTMQPVEGSTITVRNFQGIYMSPQQAKALAIMLQQNVGNYEQTFGEIKLEPQIGGGPIH